MATAAIHPLFDTPLPADWRLLTVDDIKSPEKSSCVAGPFGSNISSKFFVESGVPVIRGSNLRDDLTRFVPEGFAFVSEEQATKYKAQHVRAGDLVFTCWGTVGQVGLIPKDGPFPEYIISNKQLKLRPNLEIADPLYLFFYFAGPKMVKHVLGKAIGAAVPGINLGILKELPVVLPPLPVQRRIAGILSAYDELMENSQRRIRILEAMARALYREWFVHFRFPGHENHPRVASPLCDIPKGWEVKRLCDLFEFIGGSQPPKSEHIHEERPGYVRFVQNRDYGSTSHITYIAESRRNKLCDRLNIMVDKYGEPGKTRYGLAGAYNVALAKLEPHKAHHREWLRGLISEPDFNTYLAGASMAATRASLNSSHFTVEVPIPPDEIARAFQSYVEPLLKLVLTHQDTIQSLRRTRDLLLPRLLSGQVELEAD